MLVEVDGAVGATAAKAAGTEGVVSAAVPSVAGGVARLGDHGYFEEG
jgi:hypothetical protein